jgi:hypothetical protein
MACQVLGKSGYFLNGWGVAVLDEALDAFSEKAMFGSQQHLRRQQSAEPCQRPITLQNKHQSHP